MVNKIDGRDHEYVVCDGMHEMGVQVLEPFVNMFCCVCEGHNCRLAIEERKRAGLPPPPKDAWCDGVPEDIR